MRRAPFLLLGVLSLLIGLAGGLTRIGWDLGPLPPGAVASHGPLMLIGFLATVISLEKAVVFGRGWGYAAPLLLGSAALLLGLGAPAQPARVIATLGAAVALGVFALALRRRPVRWTATQLAAGASLLVGCALWASGWTVPRVLPWWQAFLVLTIVAERLELSRLLAPSRNAMGLFAGLVLLVLAGAALSLLDAAAGARLGGLAWIGLAAWLLRWDLARKTVRRPGLGRFMAGAVLAGHVWLAVAGALALRAGAAATGPLYDAVLHALFLGFVFSMIFGHAPVIFPAVLRLRIRFHTRFWIHVVLLHVSVLLRVAGDLAGWPFVRECGGLLSALAILLFLVQTVTSLSSGPTSPAPVADST
jgi:hypothetical protein